MNYIKQKNENVWILDKSVITLYPMHTHLQKKQKKKEVIHAVS